MKSERNETPNPINDMTIGQSELIKTENGFAFRDLNKNGRLDIYEDPRQPVGGSYGNHPKA